MRFCTNALLTLMLAPIGAAHLTTVICLKSSLPTWCAGSHALQERAGARRGNKPGQLGDGPVEE